MSRDDSIAKLEVYLDQAINSSSNDDELDISALDAFCHIIKNEQDLSGVAARLIASKIQSQNVKESLFALEALEECMDTLGSNFQIEVNKFKFLNELIRLVSKKFLGDKTPREIQDRILDILFTWTDKYPHLGKIKEAYTMLRTQGVLHEPQKNVIKPSSKKSNDTTSKLTESNKFRRMLQSKNQKDIEAANLMIQNMVRDNDRRSQMQNRRLLDLQSASENSMVLKEMLDELDPSDASEDTLSTLREIYNNCVKLKPTVMRLAEETHESESFAHKVMETEEVMSAAIELYTTIIINKMPVVRKVRPAPQITNLLDVAASVVKKPVPSSNENLSELNEFFSSQATPSTAMAAQIDATLLTPQVVPQNPISNIDIMAMIKNHKMPSPDDLLGNFEFTSTQNPSKSSEKDVVSEKTRVPLSEIDSIVSGMKSKLLSDAEDVELVVKRASDSDDDVHSLISEEIPPAVVKIAEVEEVKPEQLLKIALKDIQLDLNEIQPSESEAPRTIMDEKKGLKILVNFTEDRPAKDVMVLVITVINQGPVAISNFQFDASVSKPCKLRILEASGKELPGVKPFKPPTETINQVLLLMNPSQSPVNMMAILTYNSEDDEDPCKESIEVKDIPFPR